MVEIIKKSQQHFSKNFKNSENIANLASFEILDRDMGLQQNLNIIYIAFSLSWSNKNPLKHTKEPKGCVRSFNQVIIFVPKNKICRITFN